MNKPAIRNLGIAALTLAVVAACAGLQETTPGPAVSEPMTTTTPPEPINPPVDNCNITPPNTAITTALLTTGLPCDAQLLPPFKGPGALANVQHGFDYYSWLTFIALNAPAQGQAPAPGSDTRTLWEDWKEVSDIMLADGATPSAWDAPRVIPPACRGIAGADQKRIVRRFSINKTVTSEINQPFDTGPLIDQNGNYVRYELLVNKPMFEYIVQNGLYSKSGQKAFTSAVVFPEGADTSGTNGTMGAIMVKAAWKVMGAGDDPSRFHTVDALAYNPPSTNPTVEESCTAVTLGLVGWHAAHKTDGAPQWIWSTFEQVDNVPDNAVALGGKVNPHYNFYAAAKAGQPVNEPPPRPWDPNVQPFPNGFTSQITRITPLTSDTVKLNTAFQGILAGTVWPNYELISTQWPTNPTSPTDPNGAPAPLFLANTTLETYSQGEVPKSSSSCMDCHGDATDTTGRDSDFTFILERAQ